MTLKAKKQAAFFTVVGAILLWLLLSQRDAEMERYAESVRESHEVYALLCKRSAEFSSARVFAHPKKPGLIVIKLDESQKLDGLSEYLKSLRTTSEFIVLGPNEVIR